MPATVKIHIEADIEVDADTLARRGMFELVEWITQSLLEDFETADNVTAQVLE